MMSMFSGIIETKSLIVKYKKDTRTLELERPSFFEDLKKGDSLAVDGICLTIESLSDKSISFDLGEETLKVCDFALRKWENHVFNLERSLKFGDRVHGHYLTGHIDGLAPLISKNTGKKEWIFQLPQQFKPYLWPKGSIALNGVSLTINAVMRENFISVHLIPETLNRTNLSYLNVGDLIHVEADFMAKAIYHQTAQKKLFMAQTSYDKKRGMEC